MFNASRFNNRLKIFLGVLFDETALIKKLLIEKSILESCSISRGTLTNLIRSLLLSESMIDLQFRISGTK